MTIASHVQESHKKAYVQIGDFIVKKQTPVAKNIQVYHHRAVRHPSCVSPFGPMPAQTKVQPRTNLSRSISLLQSQHFWWFVGQCSIIVCTSIHTIVSIFSSSRTFYDICLFSVLITYAIVIGQVQFREKRISQILAIFKGRNSRTQFFKVDNVQYFLLATVFYFTRGIIGPVSGGLYPYAVYAIFHAIGYFQNELLPLMSLSFDRKQQIDATLNQAGAVYNDRAMLIASTSEVRLLVLELISLPFSVLYILDNPMYRATKVFVSLAIILFLIMRYNASTHMRMTIDSTDATILQYLRHPMVPPVILRIYENGFKHMVKQCHKIVSSHLTHVKTKVS